MLKTEESASTQEQESQSTTIAEGGVHLERFHLNGFFFEIDWDAIDPPGEADRPGIPHDEVMRGIRAFRKRPARAR